MSVKKIQKRQKHTHVLKKLKHAPKFNKNTDKNTIINNNNNNENNKETNIKKSFKNNKKSLVIAHEIKFAKLLAGNDKKVRDKVLKNLKKWLAIRSQSSFAFVEQDFMRLWKGLYYCMWMSDKPLVQEELAESLSKLVHCFNDNEAALLYTKCTLSTLASEWFGLDHYRLDKFQMLARRIIRQTFVMLRKKSWDRELINGVEKIIENILLDSKISLGFSLHITELYMEELAKVSGGNIPEEVIVELIRPFAIQLAGMDDERKIRHVMKHIFRYLIFQSDVGLDYTEKFEAWRHAGFPKGNIDSMEKVEIDEDEEENSNDDDDDDDDQEIDNHDQSNESDEKPLDPRAGRVDVELPQLPFDPKAVADLVMEYRFHSSSTTKTRRQILRIAKEFTELSEGKMPLGVKEVKLREGSKAETNPKGAALRLLKFEQELYSDTIKGKRKKKSRKSEELEEEENEEEEEEGDIDLDLQSTQQPRKKKIKSETSLNIKNRNDDTNKISSDKSSSNLNEVKSKLVERSKKKKGTLKTTENKVSDIVIETPKRKRSKNVKKSENSGSTAEINLLQNGTPLQNLKQTIKQKHIDGENDVQNSQLISSPIKKSGIINSAKKLKRNSSEGSWSISEVVDPVSPSTKNLTQTTNSILENNLNSIDRIQPNKTLPLGTPSRMKDTPKKVMIEISTSKSVTPEIKIIHKTPSSSTKKKVKIVLQRNTAQHTSEYIRQLRKSPAIPFDANRKPPVGVLKPSPIPSPVNPFYKRLSFK